MTEFSTQAQMLTAWIRADASRMRALEAARTLAMPDYWIAAGFVRNLAWDRLHARQVLTPLDDIDLVYFDVAETGKARELEAEAVLERLAPGLPWSVRNQARMHLRNGDRPYHSTQDAMRHWVEVETAIGVRLNRDGALELLTPFGLESLFALHITPNPLHAKPDAFARRVADKNWLRIWPRLCVVSGPA